MVASNTDWDPRRLKFERLIQEAHEAAIADLRQQGPMNGPTYSLRYAELVQAYSREHNYLPVED